MNQAICVKFGIMIEASAHRTSLFHILPSIRSFGWRAPKVGISIHKPEIRTESDVIIIIIVIS